MLKVTVKYMFMNINYGIVLSILITFPKISLIKSDYENQILMKFHSFFFYIYNKGRNRLFKIFFCFSDFFFILVKKKDVKHVNIFVV